MNHDHKVSHIHRITLDERVAEVLRQEIAQRHRPGDKLDTVIGLAKRLGVSKAVISQVIVTLAKEGLVDRRHGVGVFVKQPSQANHGDPTERRAGRGTMARASSGRAASVERVVGVLIDPDISHPRTSYFHVKVAQLLRLFFEERGYSARLYAGHRQPGDGTPKLTCDEFLADAREGKLCGVAAVCTIAHPDWIAPLEKQNVPVVGAHGTPQFVHFDYAKMIREATLRLLARGRHNLAMIGGADPTVVPGCLEAFRTTMVERGVAVVEQWVRCDLESNLPGAGWGQFREIWSARPEKPDGLIVADDILFRDVLMAILELGVRVPADLQVITHANKGAETFYPFPVTLVQCDPQLFAEAVGAMLIGLMRGETVPSPAPLACFEWLEAGRSPRAPLDREAEAVEVKH